MSNMLDVILRATFGDAITRSVTEPVNGVGQAMNCIYLRDFTQPVLVANRDELGDLANQINRTAKGLARRY